MTQQETERRKKYWMKERKKSIGMEMKEKYQDSRGKGAQNLWLDDRSLHSSSLFIGENRLVMLR